MEKQPLSALAQRAQILSKEEFIAAHPHPFLVEEAPAAESRGRAFKTMIGGSAAGQSAPVPETSKNAYPVIKSDRNKFGTMITVGRADNNDIILEEGSVSKFHAYFTHDQRKDEWQLTDAESRFGTFVEDRKMPPGISKQVSNGATVTFGKTSKLTFYKTPEFFDFLKLLRGLGKA